MPPGELPDRRDEHRQRDHRQQENPGQRPGIERRRVQPVGRHAHAVHDQADTAVHRVDRDTHLEHDQQPPGGAPGSPRTHPARVRCRHDLSPANPTGAGTGGRPTGPGTMTTGQAARRIKVWPTEPSTKLANSPRCRDPTTTNRAAVLAATSALAGFLRTTATSISASSPRPSVTQSCSRVSADVWPPYS